MTERHPSDDTPADDTRRNTASRTAVIWAAVSWFAVLAPCYLLVRLITVHVDVDEFRDIDTASLPDLTTSESALIALLFGLTAALPVLIALTVTGRHTPAPADDSPASPGKGVSLSRVAGIVGGCLYLTALIVSAAVALGPDSYLNQHPGTVPDKAEGVMTGAGLLGLSIALVVLTAATVAAYGRARPETRYVRIRTAATLLFLAPFGAGVTVLAATTPPPFAPLWAAAVIATSLALLHATTSPNAGWHRPAATVTAIAVSAAAIAVAAAWGVDEVDRQDQELGNAAYDRYLTDGLRDFETSYGPVWVLSWINTRPTARETTTDTADDGDRLRRTTQLDLSGLSSVRVTTVPDQAAGQDQPCRPLEQREETDDTMLIDSVVTHHITTACSTLAPGPDSPFAYPTTIRVTSEYLTTPNPDDRDELDLYTGTEPGTAWLEYTFDVTTPGGTDVRIEHTDDVKRVIDNPTDARTAALTDIAAAAKLADVLSLGDLAEVDLGNEVWDEESDDWFGGPIPTK